MRKIKVATFSSLDGIMQAPGGPDEDTSGSFKFGGWIVPHSDDALGAAIGGLFEKPFDLLLGRKTYDIFAGYWPYAPEEHPIGSAFNKCAKYVATRSNPELKWNNSRSLGEDVVTALRDIKKGDGPDIIVQGSGDLLQTLFANRLLDEITVTTFPVLLGSGKRLFSDAVASNGLKLVSSQSFPTGVITATYVLDGEVRTGSFATGEFSPEEMERRKNLA